MKILAMTVAVLALGATPAMAYVGPGAGLSLLGAFWGLLVAVLAAVGFVLLYPMRRLVRARKRRGAVANAATSEGPSVKQ